MRNYRPKFIKNFLTEKRKENGNQTIAIEKL